MRTEARRLRKSTRKAEQTIILVKPFDKNELLTRVRVGVRVLALETSLADRVKALEAAASEIRELKLQMPL